MDFNTVLLAPAVIKLMDGDSGAGSWGEELEKLIYWGETGLFSGLWN